MKFVCISTLLSGDNSTSLTPPILVAGLRLGGKKPDNKKQTHCNPTPRHGTKTVFTLKYFQTLHKT